jgi:hypothetical protein
VRRALELLVAKLVPEVLRDEAQVRRIMPARPPRTLNLVDDAGSFDFIKKKVTAMLLILLNYTLK